MIDVRDATVEEIGRITHDPLARVAPHKYVLYRDGEPICYFGLSVLSTIGLVGLPWFHPVGDAKREIVTYARQALELWRREYPELLAFPEGDENQAWYRYLGFKVDDRGKYKYAGTIMRYEGWTKKQKPKHKSS